MESNSQNKFQFSKLIIPILTLFGVIIGSVITGYFAIKTQKTNIESNESKNALEYSISKNKILIQHIENFIDETIELLKLTSSNNSDKELLSKKYFELLGTSLKITTVSDFNIGKESTLLSGKLFKMVSHRENINEKDIEATIESLVKWTITVKAEMKIIDYSVNKEEMEKDFYRLFITTLMSNNEK